MNDQTCWKGFTKIPKENFLLNNGPVFVRPVENDSNENVTCEITHKLKITISTVENHVWLLYNLNGEKATTGIYLSESLLKHDKNDQFSNKLWQ